MLKVSLFGGDSVNERCTSLAVYRARLDEVYLARSAARALRMRDAGLDARRVRGGQAHL